MLWIEKGIGTLNDFLWGWPMIGLLLGTHLFLTVRTKVIQRFVFRGIALSLSRETDGEGEISPFGALTTALASTIGTGNIIGVGTAIALGGPGAVFWCWLTGVLGMATKYGEALLSVRYRVKTPDGRIQGGPMYVLERGLHMRGMALAFALFGAAASFGIGCSVQVNAISRVFKENIGVPPWIAGLFVSILAALVIFGGIKNISRICERMVPFMCLFYMVGCLMLLVMNRDFIGMSVKVIAEMAFRPGAAAGGLTGGGLMLAMRYGLSRGLFSNESGMGSAPIAAAAAQTKNPVRQALVSATGTFWDTVIICAVTGLVLVSSILKNPSIDMAAVTDGGELTTMAFSQLPIIGPGILVTGILAFAFSTILGWAYYGERCVEYLAGSGALTVYRFLYILVAALSPMIGLDFVWRMADVFNGMMALPNLIAVLCLSGVIAEETEKYIHCLEKRDDRPVPYRCRSRRK